MAPFAGEGQKGYDEYKLKYKKAPGTIFDNGAVVMELLKHVKHWIKVPAVKENEWLFKKYKAADSAVYFCAPNGDVLGSFGAQNSQQTPILSFLKQLDQVVGAWNGAQNAKKAQEKRAQDAAAFKAKQKKDQDDAAAKKAQVKETLAVAQKDAGSKKEVLAGLRKEAAKVENE